MRVLMTYSRQSCFPASEVFVKDSSDSFRNSSVSCCSVSASLADMRVTKCVALRGMHSPVVSSSSRRTLNLKLEHSASSSEYLQAQTNQ